MGIQNIAQILGLDPDADFAQAASEFLVQAKKCMILAQENPSEQHAKAEEQALLTLFKYFFDYSSDWAADERERSAGQPGHPESPDLKKRGLASLDDMQKNIVDFSLCYMRLHRSMGYINNEITEYTEHTRIPKNVRWTADTGKVLARYKKEKAMLEQSNKAFAEGLKILAGVQPHLEATEKTAVKLLGKQEAENALRSLRAALRLGDFAKGRKVLAGFAKKKKRFGVDKKSEATLLKKLSQEGEKYIAALEKNREPLTSKEGKTFLSQSELGIVIAAQEQEIDQKIKFIRKYHGPYMEYQLKRLRHLKEKLLVVGSPEGLMTLYIRLIRGVARPLVTAKDVREYEGEVLDHVDYLLGGQFQEIKNIEERNVQMLSDFKRNLEEHDAL